VCVCVVCGVCVCVCVCAYVCVCGGLEGTRVIRGQSVKTDRQKVCDL